MQKLGSDWLYIALGAGALYLIVKNQKPISGTIQGATSVVNPLLSAAGKGASILTNPETYSLKGLTPFEYPYTGSQALRAAQQRWYDPLYWLNIPYATVVKGWA